VRVYVATTGVLFALLLFGHLWRFVDEPAMADDPWFLVFTFVAIVLVAWSALLLFRTRGAGSRSEHSPDGRG